MSAGLWQRERARKRSSLGRSRRRAGGGVSVEGAAAAMEARRRERRRGASSGRIAPRVRRVAYRLPRDGETRRGQSSSTAPPSPTRAPRQPTNPRPPPTCPNRYPNSARPRPHPRLAPRRSHVPSCGCATALRLAAAEERKTAAASKLPGPGCEVNDCTPSAPSAQIGPPQAAWRGAVEHPSGAPSAPRKEALFEARTPFQIRVQPLAHRPLRSDPNLEGLKV